jgi:hypothetical protein
MSHKIFSERLHKLLDDIDAPTRSDERVEVFSKLLKIPRFKAEALLSGALPPDTNMLSQLTQEFEVSEAWLLGKE